MMKKILWGLGLALLAAIAAVLVIYLSLSRIVKTGIETVGSTVTKCPITVEDISFKPLRGSLKINNLVVGNPEGFKTESAFRVDEINISMVPKSIFSERVQVQDVTIHAPQVTYEVGALETNIGRIQENVENFLGALPGGGNAPAEPAPQEETSGEGKKVEIDHLLVDGGKIGISATILQGRQVSLPLPKLELTDLGKEGDGQSIPEMVGTVLDKILGSVLDVVKRSGVLLKDAAKKIGETAQDAGAGIKKGVGGVVKGVKGMFGGTEN